MTDPDIDTKSNGDEQEKSEKSTMDNSVSVPVDDMDESKAQLINSNGGAGDHSEVAIVDPTDKSSDQVCFNGLGKDEVMQYANDPFWVRLRWVLFILFWIGWFAMLVTAIVIIVVAPRCPPRPDLKWYQKDTIYQAYSKSFKDSDKDGVGDFKGLKDKFDYITDDVGSNAVYLNAIYKTDPDASIPSDEKDLAIIDHKALNDGFKTTYGKFKSWIKDLRKKGQQVILDLIPNYTSKKHEWFEKSKKSKDVYKDYYIWADAPNNWKNIHGESGWTKDNDRNQYYFHSRSAALPDLNLNNEAVMEEIKDIMKYWFGAGVGGFNIQDVEYLVEGADTSVDDDTNSTQTRNTEGTMALLEELRKVANSYSDKPGRERFLFGNVGGEPEDMNMYWGDEENDIQRLHLVLPKMDLTSANDISEWIGSLPDDGKQWLGLQLGNEKTPRIAGTSQADGFLKMAHALQTLLPGTPFNYYGDEFGQKDGQESGLPNNRYNPLNARTPMQWSDEINAGFTAKNVTPWVAVGPDYEKDNLRVSRAHYNDDSSFRLLSQLVGLRGRESFQWGKTKTCTSGDVLLFQRKAKGFPYFLVMINMGNKPENPYLPSLKDHVDSKDKGTIVFHSSEDEGEVKEFDEAVKLSPGDVMVIEFAADDSDD